MNTNLQQALAASERIFKMLDTHTEVKERPAARRSALRERVEFRNVAYLRRRKPASCCDVSFSVLAGQMVAIVGLSGAGKTTLVNLIRGSTTCRRGVLIDGVDVRDVTLRSLREQVGIVTQETVLFDDTIAVNIAYASPGSSLRTSSAAVPRTPTSSSWRSRTAMKPGSASAARSSRVASVSGSPSPGRC